MQNSIYNIDKGKEFGKWNDYISKLMYFDSFKAILNRIDVPERIADYGGGNGILKEFIPNIITIDSDSEKCPDINENILTHRGNYDLIIIRYVLHYLNDYEVLELFENIKSYHQGKILVIQFCNEDLKAKYHNSKNEFKYFRTSNQLKNLLPKHSEVYSVNYECTKEFYKNRLELNDAINHPETIKAFLI